MSNPTLCDRCKATGCCCCKCKGQDSDCKLHLGCAWGNGQFTTCPSFEAK